MQDPRISSAHASFLGSAYELKTIADYDQATPLSQTVAEQALNEAAVLVDAMATIVTL